MTDNSSKIGGEIAENIQDNSSITSENINLSTLNLPSHKLSNWAWTSTGRNSLSLIVEQLKKKGVQSIYCPAFICSSVVNTLKRSQIQIIFYDIADDLSPLLQSSDQKAAFLLVHYFGWINPGSHSLPIPKSFIIEDAVQAAFTSGAGSFGSFYFNSYRKFTESPDGSALGSNELIEAALAAQDEEFLEPRILGKNKKLNGAADSDYLSLFEKSEQRLDLDKKNREMSSYAKNVLSQLNTQKLISRRVQNFQFLADKLRDVKQIKLIYSQLSDGTVPLGLPIRAADSRNELRRFLASKNIFCPVHWPLDKEVNSQGFPNAAQLASEILTIPLDQRYSPETIARVPEAIRLFYSRP